MISSLLLIEVFLDESSCCEAVEASAVSPPYDVGETA
jgi:hypothetical protein